MTRKLYYEDGFIKDFTARVVSCEKLDGRFAVILDRTAFFPEGGGQGADKGVIDGVCVLDAQERGEDVIHYLPSPLAVGSEVSGSLDWDERLRRMQNHTGEHIVSATVHRLFGYNNSGFHMDEVGCTFDFDGELPAGDVRRVERLANEVIWSDAAVKAYFPSDTELADMQYRSKKELSGAVRIVEIVGCDFCACCAPHVSGTGQVGIIKLVEAERHRGGTRITAVCGMDALADYERRCENISVISRALSVKPLETGRAVLKYKAERERLERELSDAGAELASLKAAALPETDGCLCIFEPKLDMLSLRALVNSAMEKCLICAAFCGSDGDYKYIIGSRRVDLRAASGEINAGIAGHGGGKAAMLQGSSRADRRAIEAFFNEFKKRGTSA